MVEYRFATEKDIREFYGNVPYTMRAVALVVDGVCMALIGLLRERGIMCMFSEFKPAFEPCLKRFACLRAVKLSMAMLKDVRGPVFAVADNQRLLERLGFVHYKDEVFAWHSSEH